MADDARGVLELDVQTGPVLAVDPVVVVREGVGVQRARAVVVVDEREGRAVVVDVEAGDRVLVHLLVAVERERRGLGVGGVVDGRLAAVFEGLRDAEREQGVAVGQVVQGDGRDLLVAAEVDQLHAVVGVHVGAHLHFARVDDVVDEGQGDGPVQGDRHELQRLHDEAQHGVDVARVDVDGAVAHDDAGGQRVDAADLQALGEDVLGLGVAGQLLQALGDALVLRRNDHGQATGRRQGHEQGAELVGGGVVERGHQGEDRGENGRRGQTRQVERGAILHVYLVRARRAGGDSGRKCPTVGLVRIRETLPFPDRASIPSYYRYVNKASKNMWISHLRKS